MNTSYTGAQAVRSARVGVWSRHEETVWAYVFILPTVLLSAVFMVYPLVSGFLLSFQNYEPYRVNFVGLQNYVHILTDPIFWKAVLNTTVYTLGSVPVNLALSLVLAFLIFPLPPRVQAFYKAALYLPGVTSGVVMSLVWLWIYNPSYGILNYLLSRLGVPPHFWLQDPRTAMLAILLMGYLSGNGGNVVLFLAAMGNIPPSLYEAAALDAAGAWRRFTRITVPLLRPTVLYVLILGLIGSFQVFGPIYLLTQGGPDLATITVGYQIYQQAFANYQFGLASAEAFLLAVIIVLVTVVHYRLLATGVEY